MANSQADVTKQYYSKKDDSAEVGRIKRKYTRVRNGKDAGTDSGGGVRTDRTKYIDDDSSYQDGG